MKVFADTSALYAVIDRWDRNHQRAGRAWERLVSGADELLTHNYVLVEMTALLQHRIGIAAVRTFEAHMVAVLNIHWVDMTLHAAATAAVVGGASRKVSLVDQVSFELMRRQNVSVAFAFDSDFRRMGYEMVG